MKRPRQCADGRHSSSVLDATPRAPSSRNTLQLLALFCGLLLGWTNRAPADVALDQRFSHLPLQVQAAVGETWREGAYFVWALRDGVQLTQGENIIHAREAVLWIEPGGTYGTPPWRVQVYVEGNIHILTAGRVVPVTAKPEAPGSLQPRDTATDSWLGRFSSIAEPQLRIAQVVPHQPDAASGKTYRNAAQRTAVNAAPVSTTVGVTRADGSRGVEGDRVAPAQYAEYPGENSRQPVIAPQQSGGMRRVQFFPRSAVPLQFEYLPSPGGTESTIVINSGVQVTIDGLVNQTGQSPFGSIGGKIDISADRVVIWTAGDLARGGTQSNETPLEIYMEGDIVFREGDRVIYAQSMYYNVPLRNGVILNAELLTPAPKYAGLVRLRANVIRQLDEVNFAAEGASLTTSRLAVPSYEFRAGQLTLTDVQTPQRDPNTLLPLVDPVTGEPINDHQQIATSTSNVVSAGGIPFFYWPRIVTDLEKPTFYVEDIVLGNDQVFGSRGTVTFNAYQLFGFQSPPKGTDWELDLGYMEKRGFNAGTRFTYGNDFITGGTQPFSGILDAFYVNDGGTDLLGADRFNIVPEATNRYRLHAQHRQYLENGWRISAEVGLISDRNFLEQYFEREWDDQKDQITGIEFKRVFDNQSLAIAVDYNPNEFFLRTQQLPRVDYFALGQSLFQDRLTTYGHITAGYIEQGRASTPTAPADAATFSPLPYELDVRGEKFAWRQALEYPIPIFDTKLTPFMLGEAAHWGEDVSGDALQRVYGQVGVRTSLPFVAYLPQVESELWNVHGLAHKMSFDAEYSYTDSNRNIEELPLYDEIDDDNVQHFRRRLAFQSFNMAAPVPARFDERFYGVRRGLMDNVTGPTEIVDDLQVARFGWRNRWQTKRGPEGNRRIIDWVIFDTHFELYPDAGDNFGEHAGLLDYDFRWHVGDRVTLLSSAAADFFGDGQRYFSAGAVLGRPSRGNIYVGFRSLEGPISSNILLASINYRLSAKWVGSAGLSFDLGNQGYLGQTASLTRIGESFLVTAAFNADQTRDNIGATLWIEPRFLPRTKFGRRTGLDVPLAGQYGLE